MTDELLQWLTAEQKRMTQLRDHLRAHNFAESAVQTDGQIIAIEKVINHVTGNDQ